MMEDLELLDRTRGCLLGLACGDAVGTTLEFHARGTFEPISDMLGGGPFHLKAGEWTDDTSMALCLAESLVECQGFDATDQMERYLRWYEEGHWSSNGRCFDIGGTVRAALDQFKAEGRPFAGSTDPHTAGNGSLMRLAPVVLWAHPDLELQRTLAGHSSRTTHGAAECVDACQIMAELLNRALEGGDRTEILQTVEMSSQSPRLAEIAHDPGRQRPRDQIRGSGYVVDSLEASLWAFGGARNFEDAVLRAANLGDDADTTAAITGQLAGALWGEQAIPAHWLKKLVWRDEIGAMAHALIDH